MDEQERKARGRKAVENYLKKQEHQPVKRLVPNEKPEKEVETACVAWMRDRGWSVQIYESKAVWNERATRYVAQQAVKTGHADCMGSTDQGVAVVVEFKAKGRLSSFAAEKNYNQQKFIEQKIAAGCFVCVTDSVERLAEIYSTWNYKRLHRAIDDSKRYLISMLPKRSGRSKYDKDLDL